MTTYITVEEAAKKMGIPVSAVRQLAKDNQIPAIKIGMGKLRGHYRIHRDAVNGARVLPGEGSAG